MAATDQVTDSTPAPGNPTLIVVMLSLCGIVVSLQQTLLIPLLAELPHLLNASAANTSWLVTATLLSGAVATPTVSRLADMYGKRRMVMLTLAISVVGSVLGGLGNVLPLLIAARALQGVGIAVVPVGIAIMRDELPRDRVPLGVAMMSATLAIGAGAGLPLSGLITEHVNWHACFWLTGAVGTLLMVGARAIIPESPVRTGGAFDVRGAVLLSLSLSAVLVALSKGGHWGWSSPLTLGLAAGGLVLLAAWVPVELRTPRPLVDLRVAARPAVLIVNIASAFAGFAMFANMLVSVQFLQMPKATGYGLGLDMVHSGFWMVPNAAAFGVMAPVSASLARRLGAQFTVVAGAALMAVTYVGRVFYSDGLAQVVVGSVLVGIGTALAYSALPILIMRAVPLTETASANGLNVLLRSLGTSTVSATTAAVTSASVVTLGGQTFPTLHALTLVFWMAAGAAAVTAMLGVPMLRMRDYALDVDRAGAEHAGAAAQVAKGQVVTPSGLPIRSAVVTVLTTHGEAIEWVDVDTDGRFAIVVPEADDYLVITTADGWRPRSRITYVDDTAPLPAIALRDRLTLSGTVRDADGAPVVDALVVLTRHSGEVVGSLRTDHDGRYAMPRPTNGQYVVTVAAPQGQVTAQAISVRDTERDIDLSLGTPLAAQPL